MKTRIRPNSWENENEFEAIETRGVSPFKLALCVPLAMLAFLFIVVRMYVDRALNRVRQQNKSLPTGNKNLQAA